MMTLLCGFFIMMFSMAKLDEPTYEKVKESVARSFGGDYKSPTQELAKFVTQTIEEAGLERETAVKVDGSGVAIVFRSAIFFDSLSAEISDDGRKILDKLISSVKGRQDQELKKYRVVVEGYTDGRPVLGGVFPSNWELSGARAARVIRLFLDGGFSPDRLTAIGYGDTRPEVSERNAEGNWVEENLARNRRVVVRILEPKVDSIPIPEAVTPPERAPAGTDEKTPHAR
jgi:chemotaxis protein MotB